jgi:hypothetical protein
MNEEHRFALAAVDIFDRAQRRLHERARWRLCVPHDVLLLGVRRVPVLAMVCLASALLQLAFNQPLAVRVMKLESAACGFIPNSWPERFTSQSAQPTSRRLGGGFRPARNA